MDEIPMETKGMFLARFVSFAKAIYQDANQSEVGTRAEGAGAGVRHGLLILYPPFTKERARKLKI